MTVIVPTDFGSPVPLVRVKARPAADRSALAPVSRPDLDSPTRAAVLVDSPPAAPNGKRARPFITGFCATTTGSSCGHCKGYVRNGANAPRPILLCECRHGCHDRQTILITDQTILITDQDVADLTPPTS